MQHFEAEMHTPVTGLAIREIVSRLTIADPVTMTVKGNGLISIAEFSSLQRKQRPKRLHKRMISGHLFRSFKNIATV
jgi:hypothetical protein